MTMTQTKTTQRYATALDEIEISADVADAIAQMQASGRDTGALTHETRAGYVTALCRALRLNPLTNPVQFIRLNGKEVLYVTRTATDQLAAMHGLNRRTIDGPKVTDIAGVKVALCVVEATLPNGRSETATATLPVADHVNLYMKLETKAKRRATLAILGLGLLAEDEIETIPGAERLPPASVRPVDPRDLAPLGVEAPTNVRPPVVAAAVVEPVADPSQALRDFRASLARVDTPASAVTLWLAARGDLVGDDAGVAWREIGHRILAVWPSDHTPPKSAGGWLKNECAKADAAAKPAAPEDPSPDSDPPKRRRGPVRATESTATGDAPAESLASTDGPAAWAGDLDKMRAHVAGYDHPRAVEGGARKHGTRLGSQYLALCVDRLDALTPADHHTARVSLVTLRATVERWAREGVRPSRVTRSDVQRAA